MNKRSRQDILLFSFLDEIKRNDFKAYLVIISCILFQLVLTFTKLKFTPFFLFGMFSEKVGHSDTISKLVILIDDRPIGSYKPPFAESDLLQTNAVNYINMKRNNNIDILRTRIESRYPVLYNSKYYPFFARRIYNTPEDLYHFKNWFKEKCFRVAGINSGTVKLIEKTYQVNPTTFYPTLIKNETLAIF